MGPCGDNCGRRITAEITIITKGMNMKNGKTRSKPKINFCVFCGSGDGKNPKYAKAAEKLGANMAKADIGLVYGGGSLGSSLPSSSATSSTFFLPVTTSW